MGDFLEHHATPMLNVMHESEALLSDHCVVCQQPWNDLHAPYRCTDCFHSPRLCEACLISFHRFAPFHKLSKWNGSYFERTSLRALGHVLHLGHHGLPCGSFHSSYDDKTISITDSSGVQDFTVRYCTCTSPEFSGKPTPRGTQLWRVGLFPATFKDPAATFTSRVFRDFHLLTVQGSLNAQDFLTFVRRKTNNAFLSEVKVRA